MIITNAVLTALKTALRDEFRNRMTGLDAQGIWKTLAAIIPSSTKSSTCGWPAKNACAFLAKEFLQNVKRFVKTPEANCAAICAGGRVIKDMAEFACRITSQKWESALGVDRTDIEDDSRGL